MSASTSEAPASTSPFSPTLRPLSWGIFALIVTIAFEFMAVATALPVAARELGGLRHYAWALTGFLGAAMFANGVAGEICDRIGPRLPMVAGTATFAAGLVLSGVSTSMPMLIAGRVVQGAGAGFMIVAVYVVVAQCYPETHRPRIMSLISTAWVVPSVVGPFIAGGLTEFVSWRWAFLSIAPLVPLPLFVVLPRMGATVRTAVRRTGRFRLAAMMAAGAAALQWGGIEVERHHWVTAGAAGIVGCALVVVAARRMFPPGTLRLARGLPSVIAFRGVSAGGFFACQAFVPLMLVEHRGTSPTVAGLAVAGTALGWSAGSWWQGRPSLTSRRSGLVRAGAVVTTLGVMVAATSAIVTSTVTIPAWCAGLGLLIGGLGMGLSMSSNSVLLFDLSPEEDQGANSAAIQMSDSLGGLLTIGAAGVVYALWHDSLSATLVFSLIYAVSLAVMLLAIVVAYRVRPAS